MRHFLLILSIFLFSSGLYAQKKTYLESPDGVIKVSITCDDRIYYDISYNDDVLLKDNYLQLEL